MPFYFKSLLSFLLFIGLASCQSSTNENKPSNKPPTIETPKEGVPSNPENLIEGRWENLFSDKEFIIFTATNMIRRFGSEDFKKDVITNEAYSVEKNCQGACQIQMPNPNDTQYDCISVIENEQYVCYLIIKLDEKELEIATPGGKGSSFKYKRIQ